MNKHFYLNNSKNNSSSFNRRRNPGKTKDNDQESIKKIKRTTIKGLRSSYGSFNTQKKIRDERRSIDLPIHIDLIKIRFFTTFNSDLKKKFFEKYSLNPIEYTDFNKTVLFEIEDQLEFQLFREHIQLIIRSNDDLEYSGKDYNLLALVLEFSFYNDRLKTRETGGIIMSLIPPSKAADAQKKLLKKFLEENDINYDNIGTDESFYIDYLEDDKLNLIWQNFDVIKGVISSRALTIRPGIYGQERFEYGFDTEISEGLPVVGIIDTGISEIAPFNNLIEGVINITGETDQDHSGHGTMVAGLTVFGTELSSSVKDTYLPKCKLVSIKALHKPNDFIDFPKLLEAIREANSKFGVRIFNMSLNFDFYKKYNSNYSDFAYELDRLSFELDILIFFSVGNFDDQALAELLTDDFHPDHDYPNFFHSLSSTSEIHNDETTNICPPAESLNNISVGALAGNIEENENSDVTPLNIYPAYYTRKSHFDFNQKINSTNLKKNRKNKFLNKPDLVFDGGDHFNFDSGIEVLMTEGEWYSRSVGTSLATPLITSMAAKILTTYPDLDIQTVKALLINSANYYKPGQIPDFMGKELILKKLIGFGKPNEEALVESSNNAITFIIEDEIKPKEIMAMPIYIPDYLKKSGNKLIFTISLAYKFDPKKSNHLNYLPLHISFNLVQNLSIGEIAQKNKEDIVAKKGFSWSEDHFGLENCLFSNAQNKEYRLQPKDIKSLDGELAIAIRSLLKEGFGNQSQKNPFSLVIRIEEKIKNETDFNLYNEMIEINDLNVIGDLDQEAEANLD
jgi:subtilisin family serine protease